MNQETLQLNQKVLEEFLMDIDILSKVEGKLANFNAFETLGIIHTEIRHSNILGWLLSPAENHGFGEYIIKKVVESVIYNNFSALPESSYNPLKISLMDYHDFIIRREWKNIDIIAVSEANKFVVAIENKVWSNESNHQLKKYYEIIQEEYKDYGKVFIYLTPFGEESSVPNTWLNMDYASIIKIIEKGLEIKEESISERIKMFVDQYIEIVRRYIVGDNELEKICREIYFKHKKALDLIFEYKPDIYSDISDHLQSFINKTPGLILDVSNKTYIRFTTERLDELIPQKGEGWVSTNRLLLFEFQNRSGRLALKLLIGPGDQELRDGIFNLAKDHKHFFKSMRKKNNVQFTQIFSKEILPKHYDEEFEHEEILNKVSTRFERLLDNELEKIENLLVTNFLLDNA